MLLALRSLWEVSPEEIDAVVSGGGMVLISDGKLDKRLLRTALHVAKARGLKGNAQLRTAHANARAGELAASGGASVTLGKSKGASAQSQVTAKASAIKAKGLQLFSESELVLLLLAV